MDLARTLESTPLSDKDLESMMHNKADETSVILYTDLSKYSSLKEVFGDKKYIIVLLQIAGQNVGHWIALIDHHERGYEHFDPYGIDIDEELDITKQPPILKTLFEQADKPVTSNTIRLQKQKDDINTCGRWCVARCLMDNMALTEFRDFMNSMDHDKDLSVSLLTMLL